MNCTEYYLKKLGTLKYSRLKSIYILRKELNCFDYKYSNSETKELLDTILNGNLTENFNMKFKYCFDKVFNDNEYVELNENEENQNFPENYIPASG